MTSDACPPHSNPPFRLIDETQEFVLVNKSPDIGFHREQDAAGLFELVKQQLQYQELYPVHRLDKVTSGLLLFARNRATAQDLGEQFANHRIEKYYLALGLGKPSKKQGTIKGDMVKARRGAWKLTRTLDHPAITQFRSFGTSSGIRVFLVKPATGKTHQIRVALKSLGTPIIGDQLYGGEAADRVYLHAFGLRFHIENKPYEYLCPPNFGSVFQMPSIETLIHDQLTPPWQLDFPQ